MEIRKIQSILARVCTISSLPVENLNILSIVMFDCSKIWLGRKKIDLFLLHYTRNEEKLATNAASFFPWKRVPLLFTFISRSASQS